MRYAAVPLADTAAVVGGILTVVLVFFSGLLALLLKNGPAIVALLGQIRDALHANTAATNGNTGATEQAKDQADRLTRTPVVPSAAAIAEAMEAQPEKVDAVAAAVRSGAAPLMLLALLLIPIAAGGCVGPFAGPQPPTPPDPIQVEQSRLDVLQSAGTFALNLLSDLRDAEVIDQATLDLAKPAADALLAAVAQGRTDLMAKDLTAEQRSLRQAQAAADKLRPLVVKLLAKKPGTPKAAAAAKKPPARKPATRPARPKASPPPEPAPEPDAPDPAAEGPPPWQLPDPRGEPVAYL